MSISTACDRLRLEAMAAIDGEVGGLSEAHRTHLSGCADCRGWLATLESTAARLEGISYPDPQVSLWPAVEGRIRRADSKLPHGVWWMAALILGWRALQLSIDLPTPVLQLILPLATLAALAMVWKLAGDPLEVQTWAPELRKGEM